jgi:hypothetical protein
MMHAVIEGVLNRVSASQIMTFEDCWRKWYQEKVEHLPGKEFDAATDLGSKVHKEIETTIKGGTNVLGKIAISAFDHIPQARGDLLIEHPISLDAGVPLAGFIDLVDPLIPRVVDWKTTSSIARYAKTQAELRRNTQQRVYTRWASQTYPWATSVQFDHVYIQTKGARASHVVSVTLSLDEIESGWLTVKRTVAEMVAVAKISKAEDVRPSWGACDKYGGCPYRMRCINLERGKNVGLLDSLMSPSAPAAPAAVVSAAVSSPLAQRILAVAASKQLIKDESTVPDAVLKATGLPDPVAQARALLAKAEADAATAAQKAAEDQSARNKAEADAMIAKAQAAVRPPDAPPSNPLAVAPPKRGRPPKVAPSPMIGDVPKEVLVAAVQRQIDRGQAVEDAASAQEVPEGVPFALYVNCVPSTPHKNLDGYVSTLARLLQERLSAESQKAGLPQVFDIRVADGTSAAFGKWKGMLAALAREYPPQGPCVIYSGELADPVIESLAPIAAVTVRAR